MDDKTALYEYKGPLKVSDIRGLMHFHLIDGKAFETTCNRMFIETTADYGVLVMVFGTEIEPNTPAPKRTRGKSVTLEEMEAHATAKGTDEEIAERFGRSVQTIRKYRKIGRAMINIRNAVKLSGPAEGRC